MTDFPSTHPFRYQVWFTYRDTTGAASEDQKQMAFTGPRDLAGIQALNEDITVTRVESLS